MRPDRLSFRHCRMRTVKPDGRNQRLIFRAGTEKTREGRKRITACAPPFVFSGADRQGSSFAQAACEPRSSQILKPIASAASDGEGLSQYSSMLSSVDSDRISHLSM